MTLSIAVIGSGVEAWLYVSLLARLLRGYGSVILVPVGPADAVGMIALPPSIEVAHRLLGIAPSDIAAIGQPRHGIRIARSIGGEARIPYGAYGNPQGKPFAGQWLRLRAAGKAAPLAAYSVNAALLAGAALRRDADVEVVRTISTGWQVDTVRYRTILATSARRLGIAQGAPFAAVEREGERATGLRLADGDRIAADLVVDASEGTAALLDPSIGWRNTCVAVGSADQRFDGPEPFAIAAILSAAARLVNLLPRPGSIPVLSAEYRRLLDVERTAMTAADAALRRLVDRSCALPDAALARFDALYGAAGLLPDDPQPWLPDQWLSCLDMAGLSPTRLDGEASPAAERELADWVARVARSVIVRANELEFRGE